MGKLAPARQGARAWCQVAQKFTGGIGNKLCALLYGDAEKPGESGRSEPPRATSQKACACNQKPCSCPKADVNYEFLHATGKGASPALGAAVLWSQGSR
nr:glutamate decarboxylase 2-like [Manis javanica]